MVSTGGSNRNRGGKIALGSSGTKHKANQPVKQPVISESGAPPQAVAASSGGESLGPSRGNKVQQQSGSSGKKNKTLGRDKAKPIEIISLVASFVAAVAASAGVWVSQGQLKEMKAQRAQDKLDGESSDIRQNKLVSAAGDQAAAMGKLAISSADQLKSIKASADAAIAQANAAREQATSALAASRANDRLAQSGAKQVEALLDSDRAWVNSVTVSESTEFSVGQDFVAHTRIANIGKSPAVNVNTSFDWRLVKSDWTFRWLKRCETCSSETIFPSELRELRPIVKAEKMTQSTVDDLNSGRAFLIVRSHLEYSDTKNRQHVTNACSYYNIQTKGFNSCVVGNSAN